MSIRCRLDKDIVSWDETVSALRLDRWRALFSPLGGGDGVSDQCSYPSCHGPEELSRVSFRFFVPTFGFIRPCKTYSADRFPWKTGFIMQLLTSLQRAYAVILGGPFPAFRLTVGPYRRMRVRNFIGILIFKGYLVSECVYYLTASQAGFLAAINPSI